MQCKGNFNYTVEKEKSRNFLNTMMKKKIKIQYNPKNISDIVRAMILVSWLVSWIRLIELCSRKPHNCNEYHVLREDFIGHCILECIQSSKGNKAGARGRRNGWELWVCLIWREEGWGASHCSLQLPEEVMWRCSSLLPGISWQNTWEWFKADQRNFRLDMGKHFFTRRGGQMLEQAP